jgi:Tfp pilus assembly protein PilO
MIDQLTKSMHLLFLFYAGYIAYNHQIFQEEKLAEVISQFDANKVKLSRVERDLKEVKSFEENLEESKKRVTEVVRKIETIQKQLPSEIKDAQVNGKLEEFAQVLKIINPSPVPKEEINHKFYISKDYNFDAQGTFLQFLILFEKLEALALDGRILNVKYVRMQRDKEADPRSRFQILNLSTTLEAYKYNTNFDMRKL